MVQPRRCDHLILIMVLSEAKFENTQSKGNQTWKPRTNQEQKNPNTLAPTNLVNQDNTVVTLKHNFHLFKLLH